MTNRRKKIARKAGASRHFLLSQTDIRRVDDLPELCADWDTARQHAAIARGRPNVYLEITLTPVPLPVRRPNR